VAGVKEQRPFNPKALDAYVTPKLRPQDVTNATAVYRYTVLVPVEQIGPDGTRRRIAAAQDLTTLELMLIAHFEGLTTAVDVPAVRGLGYRDPQRPQETREVNEHASFTVYAAAGPLADFYLKALQKELEDALAEGIVLVERQEVLLL
jgi:hypothetical protein